MAGAGRAGSILVKLLSSAGTGFFYVKVRGVVNGRGLWRKPWRRLPPALAEAMPLRCLPRLLTRWCPPLGAQKKNPKKLPVKLEFMKYDPRVRRHVLFTETKLK